MNDFWQENKSFLSLAGGGLLVFLIAFLILEGLYGGDLDSARRSFAQSRRDLEEERYTSADLDLARQENDALLGALGDLEGLVEFRPRPEFQLDSTTGGGAGNEFFVAAERVREELGVLAGRKRISLPQGLDQEMLKTNSVEVIERQLHALDMLDRALRLAIEHDVREVKRIAIDLDPAFRARRGLGPIERTTIEIRVVSTPESVTSWLQATQTSAFGQVLPIRSLEARIARAKSDELSATVTFDVVRVALPEELRDAEGLD